MFCVLLFYLIVNNLNIPQHCFVFVFTIVDLKMNTEEIKHLHIFYFATFA